MDIRSETPIITCVKEGRANRNVFLGLTMTCKSIVIAGSRLLGGGSKTVSWYGGVTSLGQASIGHP